MWDIDFYKIIKNFRGQKLIEVEWSCRGTGKLGINPKEAKYMIFIILSLLFLF